MKIADSDSIKDGELELIDALTGDLDWGKIEKILKEKHKLGLQDEVVYNSGDLVVHKEKIAYRLDFDVKVRLRVLFDRDGQCISLSTSSDISEDDEIPADYFMEDEPQEQPAEDMALSSEMDTELDAEEITEPETEETEPEAELPVIEPEIAEDESPSLSNEPEMALQTDFINTKPDEDFDDIDIPEIAEPEPIENIEPEPETVKIDDESSDVMMDMINDLDDNEDSFVSEDLIEDAASLINDLDISEEGDIAPDNDEVPESQTEEVPIELKSDEELQKQMEALDEPEENEESDQFKENISQMASQIAEMISEINER